MQKSSRLLPVGRSSRAAGKPSTPLPLRRHAIFSIGLTGLMNLRPDLELAIRELYGYSVIFGTGVQALIALHSLIFPCWTRRPKRERKAV